MKALALCLMTTLCLAGVAFAHQGVKDPKVRAWMHAMGQAEQASKTLGDMAKGNRTYDADAAAAAKTTLIKVTEEMPALFETPSSDPVSEALPALWDNFDDFTRKANATAAAVQAINIQDAKSIGKSMRALGRNCSSCHRAYRK